MTVSSVRTVELLGLARDGQPIGNKAIAGFVEGVARGKIPDYQVAAFLMAVRLNGLAEETTTAMTLAMRDSGQVLDFSDVSGPKIDKHSTGGVGDKLSIPLAPLVTACGVRVPMVSGRGLGHTGGTLDKLEAIPGFNVHLDLERFKTQVSRIGCCFIGQTPEIAPADRKLYALRDVTATVESIPLITSSILSKKLAEGIDVLILDVKVGRGAFMKDLDSARTLARSLVRVSHGAGLAARAYLTRMDAPLGCTIGNALEVREAIDILRGDGPPDTTELVMELGSAMLVLGNQAPDKAAARGQLHKAVSDGTGLAKFRDIISAQDGDPRVVDDPSRLPRADQQTTVASTHPGFVRGVDSLDLGIQAMRLGAGRATSSDEVDPAVGFEVHARVTDQVERGTPLLTLHHRKDQEFDVDALRSAFEIVETPVTDPGPLILEEL